MKNQINEQLALLEKELSRLKKATEYIDDTKKTAQVVIFELQKVQNNYSTYTEKIFGLYKDSLAELREETELLIKEGVFSFETTSQIVGSEIKEAQENYSTYTEKIFGLYKDSLAELREETESLIKEGVASFETTSQVVESKIKEGVTNFKTTGAQIDKTNREKLVEIKKLLENYRKIVEATDKLVKTLEAVDFPTKLEKTNDNLKEILKRINLQDKQNKIIKKFLFVIIGLIGIGGIGLVLIWIKLNILV